MSSNEDKQIEGVPEPVCRFGPGGDFVWVWPRESALSAQPGGLSRLLGWLSEVIHKPPGSDKGQLDYASENSKAGRAAYASSATTITANRRIQFEPMLFADDWRVSARAEHKPKHRIRTHRRAAKKRPAHDQWRQGSLFELDLQSARTA